MVKYTDGPTDGPTDRGTSMTLYFSLKNVPARKDLRMKLSNYLIQKKIQVVSDWCHIFY